MFENIQSVDDKNAALNASVAEKETPKDSSPEKTESKPKENDSEVAKTLPEVKDGETRFDKHSRFQELLEERNTFKAQLDEMLPLKGEVETLRTQLARLTEQPKSDIPKFETLEDLSAYLKNLPEKIKAELTAEQEAKQTSVQKEQAQVDELIRTQLDELATKDEALLDKKGRDELLKFALEYQLTDLPTAHKLFKQVHVSKDEGMKKGEEIAKRKAVSGSKSTDAGSAGVKTNIRGKTLNDVFEDIKRNIPK